MAGVKNPCCSTLTRWNGRPLIQRMEALERSAQPAFALELFLMHLLSAVHPEWSPAPAVQVPAWLSKLPEPWPSPDSS